MGLSNTPLNLQYAYNYGVKIKIQSYAQGGKRLRYIIAKEKATGFMQVDGREIIFLLFSAFKIPLNEHMFIMKNISSGFSPK